MTAGLLSAQGCATLPNAKQAMAVAHSQQVEFCDASDARRGAAACQALIERAKPKLLATAAR